MANQNNTTSTLDYFKYIVSKLDERAILEGLAEEASEVVKAALKLIRAKGLSSNTTPKTKEEALHDLAEELTDLDMVRTVLEEKDGELLSAIAGINKDGIGANPKWKRWAERLGYDTAWVPDLREEYYTPRITSTCKWEVNIWLGTDNDRYRLQHNLVCKTKEEAIALAEQMYAAWEERNNG